MLKGLAQAAKGLIKEGVKEAGRQVRQSVERQRDLQPERSEEVPVCDASSGRPRIKIADLAFTIKQCRGLPCSTWENAGTVGTSDSYCVGGRGAPVHVGRAPGPQPGLEDEVQHHRRFRPPHHARRGAWYSMPISCSFQEGGSARSSEKCRTMAHT